MPLSKIDHVAIEVSNLEAFIEKFVRTGGLKLLRLGSTAAGARIAMLGDRVGMKLELIENPAATQTGFLHVAYQTGNVDEALDEARQDGWSVARGPNAIPAAKAQSVFMTDNSGFEFQVISYEGDSPDTKTW
jgi:catechol 2,3-dioxygenase-like lactoylglutathione lyase family enzyme